MGWRLRRNVPSASPQRLSTALGKSICMALGLPPDSTWTTARSVLGGAFGRQVDSNLIMSVFCPGAAGERINRTTARKTFIGCLPHIEELPKGLPSLERTHA